MRAGALVSEALAAPGGVLLFIGMILYGTLSNTSVGELFIAGIGPGIVLALLFSVYCWAYSRLV